MTHRALAIPVVILAEWTLSGCASRAPTAPHAETRAPTVDAATLDAGGHDTELRPDMEALLREREAFFAPGGTVRTSSPAAPTTRAGDLPRDGSIPTSRVARIDAMAFHGERGAGPVCPPEEKPFTRDGRICGDVRLPIATLTDAETARVRRLLDDAETTYGPKAARDGHYVMRAVTRCDFDPHHALALYDDAGRLLGTVTICFTCHEWLVRPSSPATGGDHAAMLDDRERTTLASILDDHGLGAWIFDDADPRGAAVAAYERAVYGTEQQPTPRGIARRRRRLEANASGVEPTKTLTELTRPERDTLCRWTAESVRPARRRSAEPHGYECENGTTWLASYGANACGDRPLRCSATVRELETCLRELREPEDLCGAPIAVCKNVMECLPGLVGRPPR